MGYHPEGPNLLVYEKLYLVRRDRGDASVKINLVSQLKSGLTVYHPEDPNLLTCNESTDCYLVRRGDV